MLKSLFAIVSIRLRCFLLALMIGGVGHVFAGADSLKIALPVYGDYRVNCISLSNSDFSISLMNNIWKDVKLKNIVISPYFVEMSLCALYNGSDVKTRDQIAKVLGQSHETMEGYVVVNANLYEFINKLDPKYKLTHFSALWIKDSLNAKEDFINSAKKDFGINITPINFYKKNIAQELDKDFSEQTNGTFPTILKTVSPKAKMVMVNAQYFKGFWKKKFKHMGNVDFTLPSGKTKPQMMMFQNGTFEYFQDDYLQAVRIPYAGTDLVMEAYVPKQKDGIKTIDTKLNKETLQKWRDSFKSRKGTVVLPLFNISAKIYLMSPLTAMGLSSAFNPALANFSKMIDGKNGAITNFNSGAIISVHDDGIAVPPKQELDDAKISSLPGAFNILADHPFFFIIRKTTEDKILFMGQVISPKDVNKADED